MILNFRRAEFDHIVEQSFQRSADTSNFSVTVELFDAMDSLPLDQLNELVAIFFFGQRQFQLQTFELARSEAARVGFAGVDLLHKSEDLHGSLTAGVARLERGQSVTWSVVAS
ncbi:hypothetical protein [Bremerella sp. P1]|uniref:hypothetical protein n=1 Tax=Bremerella sp. P1 TaxID=3026424 RepID=UPI002367B94C|nr:hypothetical protein [Bremerella sp. P1]WDI43203.1 hypothetical protein PSR63_04490 [Bremerella sp. P1]